MSCVLQDDLKKFVSEPPPPPQEVEIPEEGKTKAKERREVGEGDDTIVVEDTVRRGRRRGDATGSIPAAVEVQPSWPTSRPPRAGSTD
jgi:hypothetical protein